MKVRAATLRDYYRITEMIQAFALESPWCCHHKPIDNYRRIQNLLARIQTQGIVLVSEDSDKLTGVIIGYIQEDLLFPEVKTLREIVWWVEPAARGTSAGARLLKEYTRIGDDLQSRGVISGVGMTLLTNSPDLKLQSRGWKVLETNYIRTSKGIK